MKKKVCFLVDSLFTIGGVQRVTAVIAKALARYADVTIVSFDAPQAADTALYGLGDALLAYRFFSYPRAGRAEQLVCKAYSAVYRKLGLRSRWASRLYGYSSFPPSLRRALTKELQQGGYDVVVGVHAPLAERLATMRRRLPGVMAVGWVHNAFDALFAPGSRYLGPERQRHYVSQFCRLDHLVVLCHCDAEAYRRYDGRLKPDVIYNPLTLTPGEPSRGTTKRFLAVGRFAPRHKGFDLLIEAFHRFAQHDGQWCLDIVGEGEEEPMYREMISRYGLERRVLIHPFTSEVQRYYSQAQVYVLSSRWEGLPLVLVEAMAHGLPIVATDLDVCRELMDGFALFFANGDVEALAQTLDEATRMDWPKKSRQALETARQFQLQSIVSQWKKLLAL